MLGENVQSVLKNKKRMLQVVQNIILSDSDYGNVKSSKILQCLMLGIGN